MDVPAQPDDVQFGEFLFKRYDRRLLRKDAQGNWTATGLGSRTAELLGVLIDRRGEVVSKDEIMRAVWPGTVVGDSNLTVQISALRRMLDGGGTGESHVQTVAGRGYRFVGPLREQTMAVADPESSPLAEPAVTADVPANRRRHAQRRLGAILVAFALAIVAILVIWRESGLADPTVRPRLSIVVLPFANLSGDRNEDYLAQGITDDLTSDISRLPGMFVVARQSAYTYQGKTVNIRKIGEELSVRYALEGSVRRLGDQLRVNAQLVATETGEQLWADRFDQKMKDLSAGQEEIVGRIRQSLDMAVTEVESARSKRERPTNPDAFDLVLRARSIGLHPMGVEEHAERTALYEQALRLDPTSLPAMIGVIDSLILDQVNFGNTKGDDLERAGRLLAAAAAISPDHPSVLEAAAWLLRAQDRFYESIAAYQRLIDQYPNDSNGYSQIGMLLTWTGRAEQGIPMTLEAIRRDPLNPSNKSRYDQLGLAYLLIGRDEEAIHWSRRALAAAPNIAPISRAQPYLRIAAAYARLGRLDEARSAVAEANHAWPYDTVRAHWPQDYRNPVYVAQVESFQAALRLAGCRDHAEEDADFGVASDDRLPNDLARPTPRSAPGITTIRTTELQQFIAEQKPIIIDPMAYWWGRSLPGAIGLRRAGAGGSYSDAMQVRLGRKILELTGGNLSRPIVAVGFNSERFDGRNLALRLVALGYANVYWYRGGREAWEVAGKPEEAVRPSDW